MCPLNTLLAANGLPYTPGILNGWGYVGMLLLVSGGLYFGWREGTRRMLLVGVVIGLVSAFGLYVIFRYLICCCI